MRNTDYFKGKKITVVGLARSGLACANLLYKTGAQVSVTDSQDNQVTRLNAAKLISKDIRVELGKHTPQFIKGSDLMVISPGVENKSLPVAWAQELRMPVIGEIEVASIFCPATVIAVTGSNGKTTVATLIGEILEAKEKRVFVCGNIGNPFAAEVEKMRSGDFVSLEISSFQLERIRRFKPKIAVILNFTRNHLDRYKNMQEYLEAKKRIFLNQDKEDFLVVNSADPALKELAGEAKASIVQFRGTKELNPNQAAVVAVGSLLGIAKELCLDVFSKFRGVEHRLEYVTEISKVKFINDSKSTTVESTIWALENIPGAVILIAGGRDKGLDYRIILDLAREKVKQLVLIGEAKEKIRMALQSALPVEEAASLEEAVAIGFNKAAPGDCVLLSPMCASYDMFSDYEERGRAFKKAVLDLAKVKA